METHIIHCARRTDRIKNIANLMHHFPDAEIYNAQEPLHETSQHNKAMLGCALSHLDVIGKFVKDSPVMVLEDDASFEGEMPKIYTAPEDATALLLGGEAYNYGEDEKGWREIFPKYFGTQAIVYMPAARECLEKAYRVIAESGLGRQQGAKRICFESLLLNAGMKIYRPSAAVPFSTLEDISETRCEVTPPRPRMAAVDKDPLVGFERWAGFFHPLKGRELYIHPATNSAEELKVAAAKGVMKHFEVDWSKDADISIFPSDLPIDIALAYRNALGPDRRGGEGFFFRTDEGQSVMPQYNTGDPVALAGNKYHFLMLAGKYHTVRTNRVSFAIGALIMGTPRVVLYESAFGKNREAFDGILESLGCEWGS